MRSFPVTSALTPTGGTSSLCAQRASRLCVTTCRPASTSTYTTETANCFVCAACRFSTSSANQSAARLTCFTDCCCIQSSSSTRWRSHTGGPGNASVSHQGLDRACFHRCDCFLPCLSTIVLSPHSLLVSFHNNYVVLYLTTLASSHTHTICLCCCHGVAKPASEPGHRYEQLYAVLI